MEMSRLDGYEVIVEAEASISGQASAKAAPMRSPKLQLQVWQIISVASLLGCSLVALVVTSMAGIENEDQIFAGDDALEGSPVLDSWPSCLIAKDVSGDQPLSPQLMNSAPTTFLPGCADWVINTTDQVWNPIRTDEEVEIALAKFFTQDFTSHGSWGAVAVGWDALRAAVFSTRRAFPDLRIYATDVMCYGNDIEGYKTTMPDVLQGTNTGPSAYGPATGRQVSYSGIANSFVVRDTDGEWKYQAEWVLHDEWSLLSQLGLLESAPHPDSLVSPNPDCSVNAPNWATWTEDNESRRHRRTLGSEHEAAERRAQAAELRVAELEAELARYRNSPESK